MKYYLLDHKWCVHFDRIEPGYFQRVGVLLFVPVKFQVCRCQA